MKRKYDIKDFQQWVCESQDRQSIWHPEAWQNCAFYDGHHWSQADKIAMARKGINPLTVNRVFPVVNLILGYNVLNQTDVVAKGRTQMDSEISQVMSEGMAYVMDQNAGSSKVNSAFNDSVIPGFGVCMVTENQNPLRETVNIRHMPWYTVGWDIYGDPWFDPDHCRYVYYSDWKDLDDIIAVWPEKKREIEDEFHSMTGGGHTSQQPLTTYNVSDHVEEFRGRMLGSAWVDRARRRVKPVEMYYTVKEDILFSKLEDGTVLEVDENLDTREQFAILDRGIEAFKATINKIRRVNFMGNLPLEDISSPHPHNMYPHVPFYGYMDRFGNPFGVPQQVKEQNMETNKRRSMALALLGAKTVFIEKEATEDNVKAYREILRRDGFVETEVGKIEKIVVNNLDDLATAQVELMNISEREIKEISGANDESLGYETKVMSGVALERKQGQSSTMTATLFENKSRSQVMLGERIIAGIKGTWKGPKVLRVTDRVTGADKFVELNQLVRDANGTPIEVKNNIVEGRFDCVPANRPLTDTMKERYAELIFKAIEKSPPEGVPELLNMAFELSDFPMKDQLLRRLQTTYGVEPIDPMLSESEQQEKQLQKQEALEAKSAEDAEFERQERELELGERRAAIQAKIIEAKTKQQKEDSNAFEMGYKLQQDMMRQRDTGYPVQTRM